MATSVALDSYVDVNGLRLHYRDIGDRNAAVVVLHGIMGHSREWDVLSETLADRHRVVAVDQRGHGKSAWADEYTAAAMAGDVIGLVELLGVAGAAVVGHSMGAIAAMLGAVDRPDLIGRLVIVDAGPDSLNSPSAQQGLPAMLDELSRQSFQDPQEAVDEWMAGNPRAREPLMRHYVEHALTPRADGRLVWRFDAANLSQFPTRGVHERQLWDAVDRLVVPTLVIRGQHSEALSRATATAMAHRLRHGRLVEIPNGGHDLGVEQPEAVAAAVRSFLDA